MYRVNRFLGRSVSDLDRVQFLLTPHRVRQSVSITPSILLMASGPGSRSTRFAEVVQRHWEVVPITPGSSLSSSSGWTWSTAVERPHSQSSTLLLLQTTLPLTDVHDQMVWHH